MTDKVSRSQTDNEKLPEIRPELESGSLREVFWAFLKLGLMSFGGPVAHLGYFREELVVRRRWISDSGYADLIALCQFLPGPASSQVGFALGVFRGNGICGGAAAWLGFTLPSALMMFVFALAATMVSGAAGIALLHSLKLVAVSVVAQALWGMVQNLMPDRQRIGIGIVAFLVVGMSAGSFAQIAAIGSGALSGLWLCRGKDAQLSNLMAFPVSRKSGAFALVLFAGLLVAAPIAASELASQGMALFNAFYRSGALVFGGGHVVLPLLQSEVVGPGWTTNEVFLSGYGLAQVLPGPLFSFAAYLGAVVNVAPNGPAGAVIALAAVFLPGILLIYGTLPFWNELRGVPSAQAAMRGANAAVVGILAAAFCHPVWTSAILAPGDFVIALAGFLMLVVWKIPPWMVVMGMATIGTLSPLV